MALLCRVNADWGRDVQLQGQRTQGPYPHPIHQHFPQGAAQRRLVEARDAYTEPCLRPAGASPLRQVGT